MFRLLGVIIRSSSELIQNSLIPSALWDPVALTIVGAIVLWVHIHYCSVYGYLFFMVTPCINNIQHFNFQLMHKTLKNAELLKHSKLDKNAPTCFGLHRNHLQGAKVSAWLKITRLVNSI